MCAVFRGEQLFYFILFCRYGYYELFRDWLVGLEHKANSLPSFVRAVALCFSRVGERRARYLFTKPPTLLFDDFQGVSHKAGRAAVYEV